MNKVKYRCTRNFVMIGGGEIAATEGNTYLFTEDITVSKKSNAKYIFIDNQGDVHYVGSYYLSYYFEKVIKKNKIITIPREFRSKINLRI